MTFGLIGEILGKTASILGYNQASKAIIPDWCPCVEHGEYHKQ